MEKEKKIKEHTYFVRGMHCASCEVLIEKKLLGIKGIESAEAKADKGEVLIEYTDKKPDVSMLNESFKRENYVFSDKPLEAKTESNGKETIITFGIALLIIAGFLSLNKLGLSNLINISSKSSLPAFFVFGLLAGISSCMALTGGIILSMSKQWSEIYSKDQSEFKKTQPHLMFNFGRLISYAAFGAILGLIGSKLQISLKFTSLLIMGVSAIMVLLGLQMLGLKALRKFQFTLPKFATRYIANETNFKGKYMPFIMGALTFFLPCGFTITAQGMSLLSGSPIQGALIMLSFALGTAPALLMIGISSIKFSSKPHLAYRFSRIAGFLVLFFAFFNVNNQLNVLGYNSFNDLSLSSNKTQQVKAIDDKDLPAVVNGKQVLKMEASSSGYKPNYFKVRAGIPVRLEVTDTGTSGCTNAIISKSLFDGQIDLVHGQVSVKEFTPTKPGKYKFSCWMGMVSGTIEVIGDDGSSKVSATAGNNGSSSGDTVVPSGASGCGCGGSK